MVTLLTRGRGQCRHSEASPADIPMGKARWSQGPISLGRPQGSGQPGWQQGPGVCDP